MDLSIIVVSYNTKQLLKNCLDSIYSNTSGIDFEIIVVDNDSHDGSVEMITDYYSEVIIIANDTNDGFAKANNQAIKIAKGKYCLLLNSDTIILDDSLSKTIQFADNNPEAGIIGCRVLNEDRSLQYSCFRFPDFISELFFYTKNIIKNIWGPLKWWKYMLYWNHLDNRPVDVVTGCFMLIKNDVFNKFGYLDENIFMYYEDVDYCMRLYKESDYKVFYFSEAQIIHLGGGSVDISSNVNCLKSCFTSVQYYFQKHYGPKRKKLFVKLCQIIWQLEITFFSLLKFNSNIKRKINLLKKLMNNNN